ncbi:MAG: MBL fold metallo-hydrolase [Chloroflexi bacterium]|nr:MBL fold metallo-hydrolase [Chloroflexota bacterium]
MGVDLSTLQPIHVGFTNCYPIDTGEGLALVDTGSNTGPLWELLTGGLEERGHSLRDVRWVILTHAHLDHSGLALRVKEVSGAQIVAPREELPLLRDGGAQWHTLQQHFDRLYLEHGVPQALLDWYERQGRRYRWGGAWKQQPPLFERTPERRLRWDLINASDEVLAAEASLAETHHHAPHHRRGDEEGAWQPRPIQPEFTVEDGDTLALGQLRLRVIHTPGHTPGHACYYHPESRVLFTGDHILKRITPNPGLYFPDGEYERRTKSLPEYIRSLLKVRDLPCTRVLAAHEGEMNNLEYAVDRIIMHHERRARSAMRAVQRGRSTAFEVLPVLFPNLRAFALSAALHEAIGHLDLLEEQGQVRVSYQDGLFSYQPA